MRICHVTPHLPPDQAANALLPFHLGCWAREAGDEPVFVAHPARQSPTVRDVPVLPGPVTWVSADRLGGRLARMTRISGALAAARIARTARPSIASADVVHVHSNGLLPETCAAVARRLGKPLVLTLYGTEVWHYRRKRLGPDLFTRAYREASAITFYSQGLLDHALALGLGREGLRVVYPPIAVEFQPADPRTREEARHALGVTARHLLLNVKRLHPLASQRTLLEAMPAILQAHPDTELVVCGTGALADDLRQQARHLGIERHVRLAGLVSNAEVAVYNRAADLFVLPSLLEACPTVALEALACGTRVVSSDSPGGVELHGLFGADVTIVPRQDAGALASAIVSALSTPRRTGPLTLATLEREFRPAAVAAKFYAIYHGIAGHPQ